MTCQALTHQQLNEHEIDLRSRKINCPRPLDSTISAWAQAGAIALKLKKIIITMFNIIIFFLFFALPDRNKTTWYKTLKHTPNMTTIEWMEKGLSQLAKQCGFAKIAGGPGSNPSLTRSTLRVLKLIMRMCWYLQPVTNFSRLHLG